MGSLKITESRRFRIRAANRRLFWSFHVRDVGVAGSNPVTPTTDFLDVFSWINPRGSMLNQPLGSNWVQFQGPKNHARFRLCLNATVQADQRRRLAVANHGVIFDAAMHVRRSRGRGADSRVPRFYSWRDRLLARGVGPLDCFGELLIPKRKMSTAEITALSTCLLLSGEARPSKLRM